MSESNIRVLNHGDYGVLCYDPGQQENLRTGHVRVWEMKLNCFATYPNNLIEEQCAAVSDANAINSAVDAYSTFIENKTPRSTPTPPDDLPPPDILIRIWIWNHGEMGTLHHDPAQQNDVELGFIRLWRVTTRSFVTVRRDTIDDCDCKIVDHLPGQRPSKRKPRRRGRSTQTPCGICRKCKFHDTYEAFADTPYEGLCTSCANECIKAAKDEAEYIDVKVDRFGNKTRAIRKHNW
jgi:hypothetical protein